MSTIVIFFIEPHVTAYFVTTVNVTVGKEILLESAAVVNAS